MGKKKRKKTPPGWDKVGAAIAGSILLFGVVGSAGAQGEIRTGRASLDWPETDGIIESAEITRRTRRSQKQESALGKSVTTYVLTPRYRYEVAGKSYAAKRWAYGEELASTDLAEVEQHQRQFPRGKQVSVYYDPSEPGDAVLHRGQSPTSYIILALASVALGVGTIFLVSARPRTTETRKSGGWLVGVAVAVAAGTAHAISLAI